MSLAAAQGGQAALSRAAAGSAGGIGDGCCVIHEGPRCNVASCEACVCAVDDLCCEPGEGWNSACVELAKSSCVSECGCTPGTQPTSTPPGAGPTRTPDENPAHAEGFFARGDGNCSLTLTAADVVAHARGFGGGSVCNNEDCDRDGSITAADVDCAARCLFGICPVPPHAPQVTGVAPDSAPAIVPFSVARLSGSFGTGEKPQSVSVGGQLGEVVGSDEGDLLVVVPDLAPGSYDLVFSDGDVAGAPVPVTIEAAQPIGTIDSFEDFTTLIDDAVALILGLDVEAVYGDNAPIVRRELEALQGELTTRVAELLSAPGFGELRGPLDAAIEGSGLPEQLRDNVAALEAVQAGSGETAAAALPVAAEATRQVATVIYVAGRTTVFAATRVLPVAAAAPAVPAIGAALVVAAKVVLIGTVAVAVVGGVVLLTEDTPVITAYEPPIVEPRELLTLHGRGFGRFVEPNLVLLFKRSGATMKVRDAEEAGEDWLKFRIPDAVGACGQAEMYLEVPLIGTRAPGNLPLSIRPVLVDVSAEFVEPREILRMGARGVAGCTLDVSALFRQDEGEGLARDTALFMVENRADLVETDVPGFVPGRYKLALYIRSMGVRSANQEQLTIRTGLEGLEIDCFPRPRAEIVVGGSYAGCAAKGIPGNRELPELGQHEYQWTFHRGEDSVEVRSVEEHSRVINLFGRRPGIVELSVELWRTDVDPRRTIARSSENVTVSVIEKNAPAITLQRDTPEIVEPGATIQVTAKAEDDFEMQKIVVEAEGDAVPEDLRRQEYECPLFGIPGVNSRKCEHVFQIPLRETGFRPGPITVSATAIDGSDNEGTSNELTFSFENTVPPTGGLSGSVLHQDDDSPIDAASLFVLDSDGRLVAGTESSSDGTFAIEEVPAGSVRVVASKEGFRTEEETVEVEADQIRMLTIHLAPGTGRAKTKSGIVWEVVPHWEGDHRLVEGAVVTLFDSERSIAGVAETDASGEYEIRGFWDYPVVVMASKEPLAAASLPFSHSTSLDVNFWLPWVNDECTSALNTFDLFGGSPMPGWGAGGGTDRRGFGEAELGGKEWAQVIHPDAAAICLSGGGTQPFFDWNQAWVGGPLSHQNCGSGVIGLSVMEWQERDGRWQWLGLWHIEILLGGDTSKREVRPPVRYGDSSGQEEVRVSGDAPSLRSDGTFYKISLNTRGGCLPELVFRVK